MAQAGASAALEEVVTTIAKRRRPARSGSSRPETLSPKSDRSLFVAVVHASDGVRFAASAESRYELVHRIADYVRQWGGYVLRPDHARHLRGLLARGEWEAAIELYFGLVGKRWDKEWLVTAVTTADGRPSCAGVLGEVVVPEALRDADRNQISRPAELQSEDRSRGMALARAL
jgi:hypothetical protein